MIQLIGIKRELDVSVRSLLTISPTSIDDVIFKIKSDISDEVVIITTCNRTEIYLNTSMSEDILITNLFNILGWDPEYKEYIFYSTNNAAVKHLLEVGCGFHSKILGEDQILGQIKDAYLKSCQLNAVKGDLHKLFSMAIACGKEFKTTTRLFEVPVSYSSIAAKKALSDGNRKFVILGFGKMAQLTFNYLVEKDIDHIAILGRNIAKIKKSSLIKSAMELTTDKISVDSIDNIKSALECADTLICCTASPIPLVKPEHMPQHKLTIFDLSLPENVSPECSDKDQVTLYNLDTLQQVDTINKLIRKKVMLDNKHIILKYFQEYQQYLKVKALVPVIQSMKKNGELNAENHLRTYLHKKNTKNNEILVETLLNSSNNTYINKAIEVLKAETLSGNGQEAYSIIKRIFIDEEL